jgi:hypothetical protein
LNGLGTRGGGVDTDTVEDDAALRERAIAPGAGAETLALTRGAGGGFVGDGARGIIDGAAIYECACMQVSGRRARRRAGSVPRDSHRRPTSVRRATGTRSRGNPALADSRERWYTFVGEDVGMYNAKHVGRRDKWAHNSNSHAVNHPSCTSTSIASSAFSIGTST